MEKVQERTGNGGFSISIHSNVEGGRLLSTTAANTGFDSGVSPRHIAALSSDSFVNKHLTRVLHLHSLTISQLQPALGISTLPADFKLLPPLALRLQSLPSIATAAKSLDLVPCDTDPTVLPAFSFPPFSRL